MAKIKLEDGRIINFKGTPTQADIDEAVNSLDAPQEQPTGSKSIFRPVELAKSITGIAKEEFGASSKAIQEARQREETGEQSALRTGFTAISQGSQAGLSTAFRTAFAGASAVLPDFIEDPIRKKLGAGFENFIESPTGQKVVETIKNVSDKIDTLDPKNQQLVKDVTDIALTGIDIASFGVGTKVTKKGLAKVSREIGEKGRRVITSTEREAIEQTEKRLGSLIIDTSTPTGRAKLAPRTKEGGFFTGREVILNQREKDIVKELATIPNIKAERSALFNLNVITPEITREGKALRTSLKENNFIFPKKETNAQLTRALDQLKKTDTDVIGDAEKLADRIFDKAKEFVSANEGTGLGGLTARQQFDKWVVTKKPKAFEKQDAFNTIVRSARNTINDFLEVKATKTEVKKSLQRQSKLLSAQDVLKVKAGKEASTGFMRLLTKASETLGIKNQIITILGTAVGIGTFGAATVFAPLIAVGGGLIGAGLLLTKALKSKASRKAFGNALILIEKALPKAAGQERAILIELRDEITALLSFKKED